MKILYLFIFLCGGVWINRIIPVIYSYVTLTVWFLMKTIHLWGLHQYHISAIEYRTFDTWTQVLHNMNFHIVVKKRVYFIGKCLTSIHAQTDNHLRYLRFRRTIKDLQSSMKLEKKETDLDKEIFGLDIVDRCLV